MKKIGFLFSFLVLSFLACGQQPPWTALPKTTSVTTADSCYVRQGGVMKRVACATLVSGVGGGGSGIGSLNGQTGPTQTFGTASTGTDFSISSLSNAHTFSIPSASAANRGLLTPAHWSLFNSKLDASYSLTGDMSGTIGAPLVFGIRGSLVPTLTAGKLTFNGTNWVFDNATYLTSYTETDPIVKAVNGIVLGTGSNVVALKIDSTLRKDGSGKLSANYPRRTISGTSYTLVDADHGYAIDFTNAGLVTLTLPVTGLRDGFTAFPFAETNKVRLVTSGTFQRKNDTIVGPLEYATVQLKAANTWLATGALGTVISGGGGGTGITDGDKGDIVVSSSGSVWTIDNGVVNSVKIQDGSVANADLVNSTITVNGVSIPLGGSGSVPDATASTKGVAKLYADVTGNNTDGAPDQNSVKVALATKQNSFGTQTARQAYLGPENPASPATAAFRYIREADLDSTQQVIGTLINQSAWASKTGWTDAGTASFTVASNELVMTNASGSLDFASVTVNSAYGNSNYDNVIKTLPIRVGTINSTNFGVGLDFQSNHGTAGSKRSMGVRVSLETGNVGRLYFYQSDGTGVLIATDAKSSTLPTATISAGDELRLQVSLVRTEFIANLYKLVGTEYVHINSFPYTIPLSSPLATDFVRPNCWRYGIHSWGGTNYIKAGYNVICMSPKKPPILWIGDSMLYGQGATCVENTATSRVDARIGRQSSIYASGGNRTDEVIVAEALRTEAVQMVLMIGINNITKGDNVATFTSKFTALVNAFIAGGRTVGVDFHIALIPPFSVDGTLYNDAIKTYINTLSAPHKKVWIETFVPLRSGTGFTLPSNGTDDGTHWTDITQKAAEKVFYSYLRPFLPYKAKPVSDATFLTKDINGNVQIGSVGGAKPDCKFQVVSDVTGIAQDVMFNLTDTKTGGGFYGTGTLAGGALLASNSRFTGSAHIPYATTTSQISMPNDMIFYGQTGLTTGVASSLVRRMTIGGIVDGVVVSGDGTGGKTPFNVRDAFASDNGAYLVPIGAGFHLTASIKRSGSNWIAQDASIASYGSSVGTHLWYGAIGQTPGATISLSSFEKMRLDNTGNLILGLAAPASTGTTKTLVIATGGTVGASVAGTQITGALRSGTANTDGLIFTVGNMAQVQHGIFDRVGFNTIAPRSRLHVVGSFRIDTATFIGNSNKIVYADATGILQTLAAGTGVLNNNGSGVLSWSAPFTQTLADARYLQLTGGTLSGSLTFSTSGTGIVGTTTNNNPNAGVVGERIASDVPYGTSGVTMTSATSNTIASVSLTAGDWVCEAQFTYTGNVTGTIDIQTCLNTSTTMLNDGYTAYESGKTINVNQPHSIALIARRYSIASTTTVYLLGYPTYTGTTMVGGGALACIRIR